MEEKKTVREWFNILPPEIREKAIRNTIEWWSKKNIKNGRLNRLENSFNDALYTSFLLSESTEGAEFWRNICREYSEITKEPFLS